MSEPQNTPWYIQANTALMSYIIDTWRTALSDQARAGYRGHGRGVTILVIKPELVKAWRQGWLAGEFAGDSETEARYATMSDLADAAAYAKMIPKIAPVVRMYRPARQMVLAAFVPGADENVFTIVWWAIEPLAPRTRGERAEA